MNKFLAILTALASVLVFAGPAGAQTTYTWTGASGATPWHDISNWLNDAAPSQGNGRLGTVEEDAIVVFDSETAVGNYMPTDTITVDSDWFGGGTDDHLEPTVQVLNGTINYAGPGGAWWHYGGGNFFQIGDGNMTTLAQVNTSFTNWTRHLDRGGIHDIIINADGTLNQTANFQWSQNGDVQMTLNGGTFISSGTITNLLVDPANNFVSFTALGSSFTAPYGGDFATLTDVTNAFGTHFINSSGATMTATDNGNSTFTVAIGGAAPADPEITSISISGNTATITMTGDDSVGYWCASSTDLSGFTTEETILQTGTMTPIASPFNTSSGSLTFDVDVTGDTELFLRIQNSDPQP